MTVSKDRVWESVEKIDGHYCDFIYEIRKLSNGMWGAQAHRPSITKVKRIVLVANSPGEALTLMADKVLEQMKNGCP